jgi:8-oxo-dGTP diphosphatase
VEGLEARRQARLVTVRAAGGLVWRDGRILLVHRPKYDDWTFPKGKCDEGERDEDCALREVEEETGLSCSLGAELPSSAYVDSRGRPKVVRYWSMTPDTGAFEPTQEVDEIAWCTPADAEKRLSYERDRSLLREVVG